MQLLATCACSIVGIFDYFQFQLCDGVFRSRRCDARAVKGAGRAVTGAKATALTEEVGGKAQSWSKKGDVGEQLLKKGVVDRGFVWGSFGRELRLALRVRLYRDGLKLRRVQVEYLWRY